jgi:4-amino-4-deoxy-L-arabinose transferase-like glycosyltransferase
VVRRFELAIVVALAAALFVPGIWRYSLVDPWETHYGEVARTMRQDHDYLTTKWNGTTNGDQNNIEGFRSKPVLMFWMMAAGMKSVGMVEDGGFSGELLTSSRLLFGMRIPFVASAIAGLALLWWMLARLANRRVAWLAFLVVATTPMFGLVARQCIPDMPMVACTMGAISLFAMALEDGDRPAHRGRFVVLGAIGAFVLVQALYMGALHRTPIWPIVFGIPLVLVWHESWKIVRVPIAYVLLVLPILAIAATLVAALLVGIVMLDLCLAAIWGLLVYHGGFPALWALVGRLLAMEPITQMRQVYLLGAYFLLGVSLLAKGPPGFTVVVLVAGLVLAFRWQWLAIYTGDFEIKRGLVLMTLVTVPWHVAMALREGARFVNEYIFTHILDRAASGVDNSTGTFAYYTDQLGHGMWLWAALLPAALASVFVRATSATREGRIRILVTLWAIVAVFLFCFVPTKFHHYIVPAIPALGVVVAFYLDDLWQRRERMHWIFGVLGIGIVLLVCRDLAAEPDRWIEMFTFRYDRPWPSGEPWSVDPSDGLLALGALAVVALIALCISRWGVIAVGAAGLAISLWAQHAYMPVAAKHWGMREAFETYYRARTIYGQKRVFFDAPQCVAGTPDRARWSFASFIPDALQLGQPMTLTFELDRELTRAAGQVIAIDDHEITIELPPAERAKIAALHEACKNKPQHRAARRPVTFVDADKLLAWQLYWRGEQFWSGGEIWGRVPELKTTFPPTPNSSEVFLRYLNDRERAPLGRRYFVVTDAMRASSLRTMLPTTRGRESFRIVDTQSNKFTLMQFDL